MKLFWRIGLVGQLLLIAVAVICADLLVNSVLFESARRYSLQQEDAAWLAENTALSHRIMDRTAPAERSAMARALTTERFALEWSPRAASPPPTVTLPTLRRQMLTAEPSLRTVSFDVRLRPLALGGLIDGSTQLSDGSVINFRYRKHVPWTLNLGQSLSIVLPSLLLLVIAWRVVRAMLRPLATLVAASRQVGTRQPRHIPEAGGGDVRQLIQAFNTMQERIHQLMVSRTQTMLAIAHDFRTPLARLQLRIDAADMDTALRHEIGSDIVEMDHLLQSLQTFIESGSDNSPRRRLDLAVTIQTLVSQETDLGNRASYHGPDHCEMSVRPVAFRRIMTNLVRNAVTYAGNAEVSLAPHGTGVTITVEDDGPGIPAGQLDEVLRPFTRLDSSRARNTTGMGLGLAIVDTLVKAEHGTLVLANRPTGGLRVTLDLPGEFGAEGQSEGQAG